IRRSGASDHIEDDVFSWSPVAVRVLRPKPAGRGLSALVKGLRDMKEAKLDDELEMLREMEGQNEIGYVSRARVIPKVCVEDSQVPDMPLGPDGEGESEGEDLEALKTAGKDRGGRPLTIWKKKGQKRTTRRVTIKPNTAKWKPEQEWKGGKEEESEEEVVAVGETQVDTSALDVQAGAAEELQTDDDCVGEGVSDRGVQQGQTQGQDAKNTKKSKSPLKEPSKVKKKRVVNAAAHTNYRALKIRNKNSKGKGSGRLSKGVVVLHMTIPIFERGVRAPKPCFEFMQEELGILPPKEFLEHILGLASTTFNNSDDILEQKLGIVCSSHDTFFFLTVDAKEVKDLQFSSNPFACSTDEFLVSTEKSRTQIPKSGQPICANIHKCLLDERQHDDTQRYGGTEAGLLHNHRPQEMVMLDQGATSSRRSMSTTSTILVSAMKSRHNLLSQPERCTVFMSPLPNPKLWTGQTIGSLQTQECFVNGGWWHDPHILGATGQGIEKEEPRSWDGWWNEQIVDLVELSVKQNDVLTVLLTGRGEDNFAQLIKRIVASKNLPFDMICLKPQAGPNNQTFTSTMKYKQAILQDLVSTYKDADEIRIYEDRVNHTREFREYFESFNQMLLNSSAPAMRKPLTAEVIQVTETNTTLDPVSETAEVQRMINGHNTAINSGSHALSSPLEIKRTVFFTGYLVSPVDTIRLLTLVKLPSGTRESEVKSLANNIMITPRPCPQSLLEKVGGIGRKQTWQVTGIANYESRVWAARVTPVPANAQYHTDNPIPMVVLALVKGARPSDANRIQNWQPIPSDKQYIFQTEVGEKVQLRVEPVNEEEGEYESLFQNRNAKRRRDHQEGPDNYRPRGGHQNDENRRLNGVNGGYRGGNQNRGRGGNNNPNSGNHNRNVRGGRGHNHRGTSNNNNNRGRGGRGSYKSLDDVQNSSRYANHGSSYQPNYDDGPGQNFSNNNTDGYNASFPALGGGLGTNNNGGQGGGDGGLPYGK
ncbi:MAG: hypothetical protein Q9226_000680, partial [Calogaya cf. arnoldii]